MIYRRALLERRLYAAVEAAVHGGSDAEDTDVVPEISIHR